MQVPTAIIKGNGSSDQEITIVAHLFEGVAKQGGMDNTSGSAMILEIARVWQKLINDGAVKVLPGENPVLFERYGLDCPQAVEWALRESRRCAKEAVSETAFGDRGYYPGLPDAIIHDWRRRAQSLGLVD